VNVPVQRAGWATPGYAIALSLAVTAPLLAPGYLLVRDAVSTPRSYLSDAALGLGAHSAAIGNQHPSHAASAAGTGNRD
jgi:hypothetical protein